MENFPGILTKSQTLGTPYILTDDQKAWLERYFPIQSDKDIAKAMGCAYMSVRRRAKKMGLVKDRVVMGQRYSKAQKDILESERKRVRWCLERRTKIYIPNKKYDHEQLRRRWYAVKKFGYILADDYSDDGGHRYVIYYDQTTRRNKMFEKYSKKHGFKFEEWKYN